MQRLSHPSAILLPFHGLNPRCAVHQCPSLIKSATERERWLRDPNLIPSGLLHLGGPPVLERARARAGRGCLLAAVIGARGCGWWRSPSAERRWRDPEGTGWGEKRNCLRGAGGRGRMGRKESAFILLGRNVLHMCWMWRMRGEVLTIAWENVRFYLRFFFFFRKKGFSRRAGTEPIGFFWRNVCFMLKWPCQRQPGRQILQKPGETSSVRILMHGRSSCTTLT